MSLLSRVWSRAKQRMSFTVVGGDYEAHICAVIQVDEDGNPAAPSVNEAVYSGTKYELLHVGVNPGSSPATIIAAPTGTESLYILRVFVTNSSADTDVVFTLGDDTGALTGEITAGFGGGGGAYDLPFLCDTDDALKMTVVSGSLSDLGVDVSYLLTID